MLLGGYIKEVVEFLGIIFLEVFMLKKLSLFIVLVLPTFLFSAQITNYKPEYRDAILDISFHDPELFFPGYKQCLRSPNFSKEMFSEVVKDALEDANKKTLVLLEENTVVGFVTFFKTREKCIQDFQNNPRCKDWTIEKIKKAIPGLKDTKEACVSFAKIESIAVSKKFRRRGFGKILLDKTFDYITNEWSTLGYVVLDVVNDNQPAQKLYTQFGFYQLDQSETQKMMNMFEYRKDLR